MADEYDIEYNDDPLGSGLYYCLASEDWRGREHHNSITLEITYIISDREEILKKIWELKLAITPIIDRLERIGYVVTQRKSAYINEIFLLINYKNLR